MTPWTRLEGREGGREGAREGGKGASQKTEQTKRRPSVRGSSRKESKREHASGHRVLALNTLSLILSTYLQDFALLPVAVSPLLGAALLSGINSTKASSSPAPVSPRLPVPPGPRGPNASCSCFPVFPRESKLSTVLSPPSPVPTPPHSPGVTPGTLPPCSFPSTTPSSSSPCLATFSSSLSLRPTSDKSSPSPQPLRGALEKPCGVAKGESGAAACASSGDAGMQRSCVHVTSCQNVTPRQSFFCREYCRSTLAPTDTEGGREGGMGGRGREREGERERQRKRACRGHPYLSTRHSHQRSSRTKG